MTEVFRTILNMSITASYVIVAVLLVRLCLRQVPRKYSYWLWSAVGFRLCCPVSFETVFSLFRLPLFAATRAYQGSGLDYSHLGDTAQLDLALEYSLAEQALAGTAVPRDEGWLVVGAIIWAVGLIGLLGYGLWSAWRLHRKMATAVRLEGNVYQSDQVCSPFVLGIFRSRIYIPFGLEADSLRYVLQHERYHLKRRDPWVKAAAFGLLIVHWFNPLVWLAFSLMSRDMEMSCDEHVLAAEENSRKAYSTSLLAFAANRRFEMPGPLAFGEKDVTRRIKHVLNWKQPKAWGLVFATVACVAVVLGCVGNPKQEIHRADLALEAYYDVLLEELETSRVSFFDLQVVGNVFFAGCSYDGKLGVAYFEYDQEKGWRLEDVNRWEECVPRGTDIKTTYYIRNGQEFWVALSNNVEFAQLRFTGDFEQVITAPQNPKLIVVDYLSQYDGGTSFTMTYEFYDAEGKRLEE